VEHTRRRTTPGTPVRSTLTGEVNRPQCGPSIRRPRFYNLEVNGQPNLPVRMLGVGAQTCPAIKADGRFTIEAKAHYNHNRDTDLPPTESFLAPSNETVLDVHTGYRTDRMQEKHNLRW